MWDERAARAVLTNGGSGQGISPIRVRWGVSVWGLVLLVFDSLVLLVSMSYRGLPSGVRWAGPGLRVRLRCWLVPPFWVSIINAVMIRIGVFCGTFSWGRYPKDSTDSLSHSIPIWLFQERGVFHVTPRPGRTCACTRLLSCQVQIGHFLGFPPSQVGRAMCLPCIASRVGGWRDPGDWGKDTYGYLEQHITLALRSPRREAREARSGQPAGHASRNGWFCSPFLPWLMSQLGSWRLSWSGEEVC